MNILSRFGWFVIAISFVPMATAGEAPCETCAPSAVYQRTCSADDSQPSWAFRRSTYTHDPDTGARVAQYQRIAPVEPLEDERNVTSRYRRIRTNLRGTDGSIDSTYETQAWGNGRGGLDAEWERFHDAWKESYLQNGYSNQTGYGGYPHYGYRNGFYGGPGYGGPGYGPGNGYPGGGYGPGYGGPGPWQNNGGHDGPGHHGNGGPHGQQNHQGNGN